MQSAGAPLHEVPWKEPFHWVHVENTNGAAGSTGAAALNETGMNGVLTDGTFRFIARGSLTGIHLSGVFGSGRMRLPLFQCNSSLNITVSSEKVMSERLAS